MPRFLTRIWPLLLITLLGVAPVTLACQPERTPQRHLFDQGDAAFRKGHYDLALEHYKAFVKAAPNHQLAPLAQQRIVNIERQLEHVLGRKNGPRPIYLRPTVRDPDEELPEEGPLSGPPELSESP